MSHSINRKKTRRIMIGAVPVGGQAPVAVQSMTNTDTRDVAATVAQIRRLTAAGCEIVRVAVPDEAAAEAIAPIRAAVGLPVIADIHFDHRLALAALAAGADGLRINPGNIGGRRQVKAVVQAAGDRQVPIRIGVNAGSLERSVRKRYGQASAEAMVESAKRHIDLVTSFGFELIKLSIKASDVARTVEAYRRLSAETDFPLHVGVTEAGGLFPGIVKSSLGIGMLLAEGIGDTLRVSLTRDPVEEVRVAYEILRALDIRHHGAEIISCPTCGRCGIDLFDILDAVEQALLIRPVPIKVAIMGCVVNGPGEAREADVGIAGGDGVGILFKKGRVVKKFPQDRLVEELLAAVEEFDNAHKRQAAKRRQDGNEG